MPTITIEGLDELPPGMFVAVGLVPVSSHEFEEDDPEPEEDEPTARTQRTVVAHVPSAQPRRLSGSGQG